MSIDRRCRACRRRLAGAGDAAKARCCVFFLLWLLLSSHLRHLQINETLRFLHHRIRRSFPPPSPRNRCGPCSCSVVAFHVCGAFAGEAHGRQQFRACDEPRLRCDAPTRHMADRGKRTNSPLPPWLSVAMRCMRCPPRATRAARQPYDAIKNKNKNNRRSLLLVGCV